MTTTPYQRGPCVVTLGTTGGPRWRIDQGMERAGISTAVVVGDDVYLVDCGQGTGRQLKKAGLNLEQVKGIFLTHLHSDHVADLSQLVLFSLFERHGLDQPPITLLGPGSRGKLPPASPALIRNPATVAPKAPTPGTEEMFRLLVEAFASDFNDRMLDTAARSPYEHFRATDIQLPGHLGFDPDSNHSPEMEPIEVYSDLSVTVRATLVSHPPMAPAFGFRFDTPGGSVTISGDTAPSDNLVRLATDTDLLLHEAIGIDLLAARSSGTALATASIAHHRRAHTTPVQAGEIAQRARARQLGLHHLVPMDAPLETWLAARETFDGLLHVPCDLDIIGFGSGDAEALNKNVPAEKAAAHN